MIVGGGKHYAPLEDQLGHTDDSVTHPAITKHLREVCGENFEGWGDEALGEGLITDWTGIIGNTPDCKRTAMDGNHSRPASNVQQLSHTWESWKENQVVSSVRATTATVGLLHTIE